MPNNVLRRDRRSLLARVLRACVIVSAAVLLAGPVAAQDDWAAVEAAAKKEGRLVVYSAYVGAPSSRAIIKAFEAKFGIPVDLLEARASEIRERIRTEQAAGRFAADVLFTSVGQAKLQELEEKALEPLPQMPNTARLTGFKPDTAFVPTMSIPYGILINTALVPADQEPKTWADLADPKWKGKILADDPRAIGGGYLTMFVHHDTPSLGKAFLEKYAAQGPVFTRDQRQSQQRVARGEYAIYMPFILTDYDKLQGLPVKHIIPAEGVPYVLYGYSLLQKTPRPNAARLYINFALSEEAQLIWAREGHGVATAGIAEKVSETVRPIVAAKLLGTSDSMRQNEMLGLAKKLFK